MKMGKGFFIIQVGELVIVIAILIVTHFNNSILHTKSISKIYTGLMMIHFHYPVVKVMAIEKFYPFIAGCGFMRMGTACKKKNEYKSQYFDHFVNIHQLIN